MNVYVLILENDENKEVIGVADSVDKLIDVYVRGIAEEGIYMTTEVPEEEISRLAKYHQTSFQCENGYTQTFDIETWSI